MIQGSHLNLDLDEAKLLELILSKFEGEIQENNILTVELDSFQAGGVRALLARTVTYITLTEG